MPTAHSTSVCTDCRMRIGIQRASEAFPERSRSASVTPRMERESFSILHSQFVVTPFTNGECCFPDFQEISNRSSSLRGIVIIHPALDGCLGILFLILGAPVLLLS